VLLMLENQVVTTGSRDKQIDRKSLTEVQWDFGNSDKCGFISFIKTF